MAVTTRHGLTKSDLAHPDFPDQFGRYALVLLGLAVLFTPFRAYVFAQLVFWMFLSGGVALVLFSIFARPLGSPQKETWLAGLLYAGVLLLILLPRFSD